VGPGLTTLGTVKRAGHAPMDNPQPSSFKSGPPLTYHPTPCPPPAACSLQWDQVPEGGEGEGWYQGGVDGQGYSSQTKR
jgi:hypothetical protein